jgi:hypothetical protein
MFLIQVVLDDMLVDLVLLVEEFENFEKLLEDFVLDSAPYLDLFLGRLCSEAAYDLLFVILNISIAIHLRVFLGYY